MDHETAVVSNKMRPKPFKKFYLRYLITEIILNVEKQTVLFWTISQSIFFSNWKYKSNSCYLNSMADEISEFK